MVLFTITNVKDFMSKLLIKQAFDEFSMSELEMNTYNKFHIAGRLNQGWFTQEEREALGEREYSLWSEIRPMIFQLVKGSKTPLSFKMVFLAGEEVLGQILANVEGGYKREDVDGLFLTIRYEKTVLQLVTGTSMKRFTLDKELERCWDSYLEGYLKQQGIDMEES